MQDRAPLTSSTTNAAAVRGTSHATSGGIGVAGVTGTSTSSPGNMAGVMGLNNGKFGTAGWFHTASINSSILAGQFYGQQIFAVDPTGRVIGATGLFQSTSRIAAVTGLQSSNRWGSVCHAGYLGGGGAGAGPRRSKQSGRPIR